MITAKKIRNYKNFFGCGKEDRLMIIFYGILGGLMGLILVRII